MVNINIISSRSFIWSSFYGTTCHTFNWISFLFQKYKNFKLKSFLIANILSVGILLFIFKLLLPSTLSLFGNLEVFFVNDLGLPFNSGTIFSAVLIICSIYYGLSYTAKKDTT